MAGTRKNNKNMEKMFIVLLLIFNMTASVNCIQCISQQNEPIDWFIAYKLPGSHGGGKKNSFFYMDVNSPSWTLSHSTLDDSDQAVAFTLNQLYSTKQKSQNSTDIVYVMYNDEVPETHKRLKRRGEENGHTKGVIAFDSKSGFWLVHSTPKFPPPVSSGYSWPSSAEIYGQSFLCISMATFNNLEEIGQQLLYNYPQIYDQNIPPAFQTKYPNMAAALAGKHVTSPPWFRETALMSLAGIKFASFAKFSKFDNDLYAEWLAPRFGDTLLVETWQNGRNKLCSNCTGKYKVFNVETIRFKEGTQFTETQDHSKWAVTNTSVNVWTCIGDINRQQSQMTRPGGTVCFQNKAVWQNFHNIISSYHPCGPYRECVQPVDVSNLNLDVVG